MTERTVAAVILAGSRPGADPFAEANGVKAKALIPIAGKPMLFHVAEALSSYPAIRSVEILAQDFEELSSNEQMQLIGDQEIQYASSKSTIAATLEGTLDRPDASFPILLTTADNALISEAMLDQFIGEGDDADIAIAVVEKQTLLQKYPDSARTWLKFRAGHYSGANLFLFSSKNAKSILNYWGEVEQDRKKGWRMLSIFGPWLLCQVLLRRLTIDQMAERVGRKLGLKIAIVQMDQAEACIDVDKAADLKLVEKIMNERRAQSF